MPVLPAHWCSGQTKWIYSLQPIPVLVQWNSFVWALRRDNSTQTIFSVGSLLFSLSKDCNQHCCRVFECVISAVLAHLAIASFLSSFLERIWTHFTCSMLHAHLERRWQLVSKWLFHENSHTSDDIDWAQNGMYSIRKCWIEECRHHGCYATSYRTVSCPFSPYWAFQ